MTHTWWFRCGFFPWPIIKHEYLKISYYKFLTVLGDTLHLWISILKERVDPALKLHTSIRFFSLKEYTQEPSPCTLQSRTQRGGHSQNKGSGWGDCPRQQGRPHPWPLFWERLSRGGFTLLAECLSKQEIDQLDNTFWKSSRCFS
jgi:hypothetical protein